MFVYILNCHDEPLMPCRPRKARILLKAGKATVVKMVPFTLPTALWQFRLQTRGVAWH